MGICIMCVARQILEQYPPHARQFAHSDGMTAVAFYPSSATVALKKNYIGNSEVLSRSSPDIQ